MENSKFFGTPTRRDWKLTKMVMDPDTHFTTFNPGDLVPFFTYLDCLPGEEYEIGVDFLVRSLTPMVPVMDNAYLDIRAFFVPARTQWEKFENFMGSNPDGFWVDTNVYTKPMIRAGANGFLPGSVADHFRLPTKVANVEADALPFRAYVDIYNNYFRSTDVNSPGARPLYSTTDTSPTTLGDPITEAYKGGSMFKVNRLADYFSTGTPQPIRSNSPVYLTLPNVPVVAAPTTSTGTGTLEIRKLNGDAFSIPGHLGFDGVSPGSGPTNPMIAISDSTTTGTPVQTYLQANTSALGISVDDLRRATQYYRLLQRDLYGSRFKNLILAHFGANLPDSTAQVPQYIGGRRYRLNQQQVAQTSATGSTGTPLGNMGAYSLTISGNSKKWRVACPEWGMLIILCCVRVKHSYQEGLPKMWTRKTRLSYFWPEFSQLGAFPTYKKEIKATGSPTDDDAVFNYQEAWDDYRTIFSGPSGNMRSNVSGSLDIYHYADYYGSSIPSFSSGWLAEGDAEIKRTLAVQTGDLFFGKFVTSITKTTPVPMFSTGSMMDHF